MTPITNGGSNRQYFRDGDHIHVVGTNQAENHAFITMARHFRAVGLPVPEVYQVSGDEMQYDIEDLGDRSLFDIVQNAGCIMQNIECKSLLEKTMRLLAHFQIEGDKGLDYSVCFPQPTFNRRSVLWDLNYFKYCYLKATHTEFLEDQLEDDFEHMANELLKAPLQAFMYRDFQSRNVMLKDGEPWFIDFQGGRKGPVYYDVASFLWQAKANYPQALRDELIEVYLDELETLVEVNREAFKRTLQQFIFFRTLQVLGAYGFRGYFEKKPHFLQSIPFALKNLQDILPAMQEQYPYLCSVLASIVANNRPSSPIIANFNLIVDVYSFSYKKGIPTDESGNGGGFVFDCRAPHNPGRYDEYKQMTGLDEPVIRFIEQDGELLTFLDNAYKMVDQSISRYIERGFEHLMVCFGCTGGQHRSVYAAEHMAQHIKNTFGVTVHLHHREQQIEKVL